MRNKLRIQNFKRANIASDKKPEEIEMIGFSKYTSSEESVPLVKPEESILSRQATKISDINNADDFSSWFTNESKRLSKKAFDPNKLTKYKILDDRLGGALAYAAITAACIVGIHFLIMCLPFIPLIVFVSLMGAWALISSVCITVEYVCDFKNSFASKRHKVISEMTVELIQATIKELLNNDKFSNMTKGSYRELAKAISTTFERAEYYEYGSKLASRLMNFVGKINSSDNKDAILQEITDTTTYFIQRVFDKLEDETVVGTAKKNLERVKKEFASSKHDVIQKSESLNKFITGVYNILEKSDKDGEDKISLEQKEIVNAIQQGINNYFSSLESNLSSD